MLFGGLDVGFAAAQPLVAKLISKIIRWTLRGSVAIACFGAIVNIGLYGPQIPKLGCLRISVISILKVRLRTLNSNPKVVILLQTRQSQSKVR